MGVTITEDQAIELASVAFCEGWREGAATEASGNNDSPEWSQYEDWLESESRSRAKAMFKEDSKK